MNSWCPAESPTQHNPTRLNPPTQVLLPESIPFLAELVDDPDEGVEATARRLVASLSELSGEDLRASL
jgi:hypothetical protein